MDWECRSVVQGNLQRGGGRGREYVESRITAIVILPHTFFQQSPRTRILGPVKLIPHFYFVDQL